MKFSNVVEVEENGQKVWKLEKKTQRKLKAGVADVVYRSVEVYSSREEAEKVLAPKEKVS